MATSDCKGDHATLAERGVEFIQEPAERPYGIEALDWVTGEQKVTGAQDNADVCGWADGVLVWFEIRDGRMRGWRQRPCGAAAARRHLTGTPPGWADFARRNAELAARLRSPRAELAARLKSAGRS